MQKLCNYFHENYYMVFDSMVVLDNQWCVLGVHDNQISPGLVKVSISEALAHFDGADRIVNHLAVSSVAADLSGFGRIKLEAETAMQFGKAFEPESQIYFYDDYMVYDLFSQSIDNRVMVRLYNDVIKWITQYDNENKTELMETLRTLVASDFNMQIAAERLFIHRNTLYRRIEKLRELLDLNSHNLQNYLMLQIAVRLQRLLQ